MNPTEFFWRSNAAVLRRSGALLSRLAERAYFRAEPKQSAAEKNLLRENEKLRNRHAGQRCFVIGNGPSLTTQDLTPLAGEITFVMNAFWKHPILDDWQPTYFCFADPVWYDGSEAVIEFFDSVRDRTPKAKYIFPLDGKPIVEKNSLLPLESTYFFAYQEQPIGLSVADTFDLTVPVPYPFSASQLAIMAAMFMGCTPIYLMGLDHDWLAHRGQDTHFFSGRSIENHPKATGELNYSYDSEIEAMGKLWKGYKKLSSLAAAHGIQIFNATAGGFLDVFERVNYESLFDSAS
ncbi:MAG TPA: hypothetical protein DC054_18165 [Blastocatellia bacterium]|nr:hypothetical protein [Blastocatellia bacterium]